MFFFFFFLLGVLIWKTNFAVDSSPTAKLLSLLKMMAEMLLKAQKYMNAEDALATIKDVEKTSEKGRKEGRQS